MGAVIIDTNIVVRFLVEDNVQQAKKAAHLVENSLVELLPTVLLETVWVLEKMYEIPRNDIFRILTAFCKQPTVIIDRKSRSLEALEYYRDGFDFADALHYLLGEKKELKTFDRKFANRAKRKGLRVSLP